MFSVSRLFSKKSDLDAQDHYIKVASLIEEGSVLDRRKISDDRRSMIERRIRLRDAFSGSDKRIEEERRASSRREKESSEKVINNKSEDANVKEIQSLSDVEKLVRDQINIIENISELSETARINEFQGVREKIRDISFKVRSITSEEEKLLYINIDKKSETDGEKKNKSLAEILFYIHDVSDQVLEYLDRYHIAGVTEANVGFFLLDMNIVYKALSQILNKKKEHLYPLYK